MEINETIVGKEMTSFLKRYNNYAERTDGAIQIDGENLDNYFVKPGAYEGSNCTNSPVTGYVKVLVIRYSEDWFVQQLLSQEGIMYLRARRNKTVSDWQRVHFNDNNKAEVEITIIEKPSEHPLVTEEKHGYMSSNDKIKLNYIDKGANNYTHPSLHPASMITVDELRNFVTLEEKRIWNDKCDVEHTHEDYSLTSHSHTDINDGLSEIREQISTINSQITELIEAIKNLEGADLAAALEDLRLRVDTVTAKVDVHTEYLDEEYE